jgi:hypothetical protein
MNNPVALAGEDLAVFPSSYGDARKQLLTLSQRCSLFDSMLSLPLESDHGTEDERLSTEVIWFGPKTATRVVVLISATHGVEGFVGAAVQTDLLTRLGKACQLPQDTAVLMVFALNPYGFAHCRRCDEAGIDLNRNFVDFEQPLPENTGYGKLREAIYCVDAEQRHRLFEAFRQQQGQPAFEIAVSGGQYVDPNGPFYGGVAPAHGHRVIERLIEHYQLAQRRLAVVDVHSGLGPYGHGEVINDHPLQSRGYMVANRWYGASVAAPALGNSSSVSKLGLLDYHWHTLMQNHGCFVTLEFGTYPTQDLFDVVLDDHRAWKSGDDQAMRKSADAMKKHFYPQDVYWRELVLVKGRQVVQQAMDGLQHD